jgi:hypothetical protein
MSSGRIDLKTSWPGWCGRTIALLHALRTLGSIDLLLRRFLVRFASIT